MQPAMDPVNAIVCEKQESTNIVTLFYWSKTRSGTHNGIDANK